MTNHYKFYEVVSGSRAYGFANENSDYDYRGIFFPNRKCFFGMETFKDPIETKDPDTVFYSFKKFISLALSNNPNILELLFIDDANLIIQDSDYIKKIKDFRNHFLSKRIFTTYLGYVKAQMHKIKNEGNCSPEMNSRRMEDIKKNGYDTKAASHVLRLLFQGIDLVKYKTVSIPLSFDDAYICKITREGLYSFKSFIENSNGLIDIFKELEKNSDLPNEPNFELINYLVMEINEDFYKGK